MTLKNNAEYSVYEKYKKNQQKKIIWILIFLPSKAELIVDLIEKYLKCKYPNKTDFNN